MATATNPATVMEATESFVCDIDEERFFVHANQTRVAAEHPLVKRFPEHFRPLDGSDLTYQVEEATAEPGRRSRPMRPHREATPPEASEPKEPQEGASQGETTGLSSASLRQKPKDKEN